MDPKAQMPDIKSEVNKVDDGKKKASGLLSGLFGGGGGSAAGGLGGVGGLGAGAMSGGGLLATKAGMLALVLMGSAVAGGIGLAGYKMFGPGDSDKAAGGNLQLFAAKPQAAEATGVAPVNADGSSASLNFAAAAAAKDKAADAAADGSASAGAPTDKTAGDAAKDAAAAEAAKRDADAKAAAGAAGSINAGSGAAAAAGSMGHGLANVKKLGGLSTGGGGGASTSAGSGSSKLGDNLANAAKNGPSSAFSRQSGGAAKNSSGGARAVGGRGRSARKELGMVSGDHMGGNVGSSYGAGKTYDGSATRAGGAIGPDGGAIGMDGAGDGAGAQPKSLAANSAANTKKQDPPIPEPPAKDVTPWAKQIMIGMALGALAVVALYYASTMLKEAKTEAMTAQAALLPPPATAAAILAYNAALAKMQMCKLIIGAAIAAALAGALMGGMIAGGTNGQTLQGGLLIASSLALAAIGSVLMSSANIPSLADASKVMDEDAKLTAFSAPGMGWMYIVGAIGLVGAMMSPKKTCKSTEDSCHAYYQERPIPVNYTV